MVPNPSASASSASEGSTNTWPLWNTTTGSVEPSWPASSSSRRPAAEPAWYQPWGIPMRVSMSRSSCERVAQRGPTIRIPSNEGPRVGVQSARTWLTGRYRKRATGSHGSNR